MIDLRRGANIKSANAKLERGHADAGIVAEHRKHDTGPAKSND
jgi:hypothetical protein